jgi:uncharacterized glyoxalase superfamily protein PhnB
VRWTSDETTVADGLPVFEHRSWVGATSVPLSPGGSRDDRIGHATAVGIRSGRSSEKRETAMYNPDDGFPRVVPELVYRDVAAALDWLSTVFGFRETLRHTLDNGQVSHADMDTGCGGVVMLTGAGGELGSPDGGHVCTKVIVLVDDVDGHFAAVEAAGVEPLQRPTDKPWGLRQYLVKDREGHLWEFSQHVRDVPAQDWGARTRQP